MIYFFLAILSFLLTYLVRKWALKKVLLDIPNQRSSHDEPTPHGGGIAISITWFIGLFILYHFKLIQANLFYSLLLGLIISIVSFMDDIYHLSPKIRLATQAFLALGGLCVLGGLKKLDFGFFEIDSMFFTNIFAFFMIIWFINLYNFLDGIDGYAGSEAIFLGISGFLFFQNEIFLLLIVSVFGFLCWNWHRAKIFMGDSGSTLLGYNVAILGIYLQNSGISLIPWIILFGLFWFDASLTLFRRWRNGESLHVAHKKHAYQRLHQVGFSHDKIVILGMIVNIFLFILAYFSLHVENFAMIFFLVSIAFLYVVVTFIDTKKGFF